MTFDCVGVTVPNTHDIDKLVRMSKNNGSNDIHTHLLPTITGLAASIYIINVRMATHSIRTPILLLFYIITTPREYAQSCPVPRLSALRFHPAFPCRP